MKFSNLRAGREKEKAVLTSGEWRQLEHTLLKYTSQLVPGGTSKDLWLYVFERTTMYSRFSEVISPRELREGNKARGFAGLGVRDRMIHHCRALLSKRGVIGWEVIPYKRVRVQHYRLNVPGMLDQIVALMARTELTDSVKGLPEIRRKSAAYYNEVGWNVSKVMPMEKKTRRTVDAVKDGLEKSKRGMERRRRKQMMQKGNVGWIVPKMQEWCEEANLKFVDAPTKKRSGQMRNWLNECGEAGRDATKTLYAVCTRWRSIRDYLQGEKFPNNVALKKTVSFSEFYQHRIKFYSYLEGYSREREKRRGKIVVIREGY